MEPTQKSTKSKQMSWTEDMATALMSSANQAGLPNAAWGKREEKLNAIVALLSPQAAFVGGVTPTQVAQKIVGSGIGVYYVLFFHLLSRLFSYFI